ncbi:hypothetical protein [Bacillus halotolerans]|uniref:Uncharacterized protein n=1 Tax=Bacillus halotolerans TaxID=260554 RepID=A0A9Q4ELJ7_9BACI|nr:hypothetical protein [Bacillus halotolerans]MCY9186497.1 hypothetical protein [Bacillus halotolerans]
MVKTRFCFRVSKEADMAQDEHGNSAPLYSEIQLEHEKEIKSDQYEELSQSYREGLANFLEIEVALIEPITNKEYDAQQ